MSRWKLPEGYYILPEIAVFLSGFFFTALVFLWNNKEAYIKKINIFEIILPFSYFDFLALVFSTSTSLFLFSAISTVLAGIASESKHMTSGASIGRRFFGYGLLSMFISLFAVFVMINRFIAIIQFFILIYWVYREVKVY